MGRGREPWERSEAGGVNDNERHLRHSPVSSPTEELRKDKRRSDDSGRRERTRPGLLVCVLCAAVVREGLPLYFYVCLFLLNLCWMFAGSRLLLPDLRTLLHWCRNPGGRRDMLSEEALAAEGIAVLRRSGSTEKRRPPVAARGGGAGTIEDQVGRKARCRAPGLRRGGCRPRGSGGVGVVRQEAGACCHPPCLGRSRERGTRCRLPSTGGAIAVRQEAEER